MVGDVTRELFVAVVYSVWALLALTITHGKGQPDSIIEKDVC